MVGYNSQVTKGDYRIQFETDDYEYFKQVEGLIRSQIDESRLHRQELEKQQRAEEQRRADIEHSLGY